MMKDLQEMVGGGRERIDLRQFVSKYISDNEFAKEFNLENLMQVHGDNFVKAVSYHCI